MSEAVTPADTPALSLEYRAVSLSDFEFRDDSGSGFDGVFEGIANRSNIRDSFDTEFRSGAWRAGGLDESPYPYLFMHDPKHIIGITTAREDGDALRVKGQYDPTDLGQRARAQAKTGSAPDLSVGFVTLKTDPKERRIKTAARLGEISQITARMGSNPGAGILQVRCATCVDCGGTGGAACPSCGEQGPKDADTAAQVDVTRRQRAAAMLALRSIQTPLEVPAALR